MVVVVVLIGVIVTGVVVVIAIVVGVIVLRCKTWGVVAETGSHTEEPSE